MPLTSSVTAGGVLLVLLTLAPGLPAHPAGPELPPGAPAPAATHRELWQALTAATERFEALDAPGVLAHVSDAYRNGPITKASIREQLLALFTLYDTLRARVRLDDVRLVNGTVWVYSSGEVSGRLRGVGAWTTVLSWEHEPEVARRERSVWRLLGPGP